MMMIASAALARSVAPSAPSSCAYSRMTFQVGSAASSRRSHKRMQMLLYASSPGRAGRTLEINNVGFVWFIMASIMSG